MVKLITLIMILVSCNQRIKLDKKTNSTGPSDTSSSTSVGTGRFEMFLATPQVQNYVYATGPLHYQKQLKISDGTTETNIGVPSVASVGFKQVGTTIYYRQNGNVWSYDTITTTITQLTDRNIVGSAVDSFLLYGELYFVTSNGSGRRLNEFDTATSTIVNTYDISSTYCTARPYEYNSKIYIACQGIHEIDPGLPGLTALNFKGGSIDLDRIDSIAFAAEKVVYTGAKTGRFYTMLYNIDTDTSLQIMNNTFGTSTGVTRMGDKVFYYYPINASGDLRIKYVDLLTDTDNTIPNMETVETSYNPAHPIVVGNYLYFTKRSGTNRLLAYDAVGDSTSTVVVPGHTGMISLKTSLSGITKGVASVQTGPGNGNMLVLTNSGSASMFFGTSDNQISLMGLTNDGALARVTNSSSVRSIRILHEDLSETILNINSGNSSSASADESMIFQTSTPI
jgi:hypothetical protein